MLMLATVAACPCPLEPPLSPTTQLLAAKAVPPVSRQPSTAESTRAAVSGANEGAGGPAAPEPGPGLCCLAKMHLLVDAGRTRAFEDGSTPVTARLTRPHPTG